MLQKIKKAIIPAAGLGTRLLPITKSIPKEMIPIVDKAAIHFLVEEAIESGIEEILIIISSKKSAIIDYFDYSYELQSRLIKQEKTKEHKTVSEIANLIDIAYMIQKEPLGLGHAIYLGKNFVKNEPFAVLLGDDLVIQKKLTDNSALKQCINQYEKYQSTILGIQEVNPNDAYKYGIVDIKKKLDSNLFEIKNVVEKPKIDLAPSNYAVLGRYVFTPCIFNYLKNIKPDENNEIQLTSAIANLINDHKVMAYEFSGNRYDIGSKIGFVKAIVDIGLNHSEIKEELDTYLRTLYSK